MNTTAAVDKIKQNKSITAVIIVIVIAVIIYYFRDKIFGKTMTKEEDYMVTNASGSSSASKSTYTSSNSNSDTGELLKMGSKGNSVKELQRLINKKQKTTTTAPKDAPLIYNYGDTPGSMLTEDGIFGAKTEHALYRWTQMKSITLAQAHKLLA